MGLSLCWQFRARTSRDDARRIVAALYRKAHELTFDSVRGPYEFSNGDEPSDVRGVSGWDFQAGLQEPSFIERSSETEPDPGEIAFHWAHRFMRRRMPDGSSKFIDVPPL